MQPSRVGRAHAKKDRFVFGRANRGKRAGSQIRSFQKLMLNDGMQVAAIPVVVLLDLLLHHR